MLGVVHFSSSNMACCTCENWGRVLKGTALVTSGLALCDQHWSWGCNIYRWRLDYLGERMHLDEVEAGLGLSGTSVRHCQSFEADRDNLEQGAASEIE